jgi:hypothetical protein
MTPKHPIRKRIIGHTEVRAGDLVPHPMNFHRHPESQQAALADSLAELGDIRSLLGYRLPDGRIQLIDGHLRRDLDPDRLVTVELVDLTPDEAAKALLTLDPLAALAETDAELIECTDEAQQVALLERFHGEGLTCKALIS